MQPSIAKINRKQIQRTVVLVVVLGIIIYGFYWLLSKHGDPDLLNPPAKTAGDIAAIELKPDGAQAVIIKPDGSLIPSPEYTDGASDSFVTWRDDGGRLFFDSDRYKGEPHVFRWDPDTNILERRTVDKRSKGFLSFADPGESSRSGGADALLVCGGTVLRMDANTGISSQLLPPPDKNAAQGTSENGGQSTMTELYDKYGQSFSSAHFGKDRSLIVAVMNRDDGSQSLIAQDMTQPGPPVPILQAEHVWVDVGQTKGIIVVSAEGYELPAWLTDEQLAKFRKGDKIVPPFKHLIAIWDPAKPNTVEPIVASNDDKFGFGEARISPDESEVALTIGPYVQGALQPAALFTMPLRPGGAGGTQRLAVGPFSRISWSPDGTKILAIESMPSGRHDVVTIENRPNGLVDDITRGQGDFSEAVFSPQLTSGG